MLRWVGRVVRWALLIGGTAALLGWPLSPLLYGRVALYNPTGLGGSASGNYLVAVYSFDGKLVIGADASGQSWPLSFDNYFELVRPGTFSTYLRYLRAGLVPEASQSPQVGTTISLPLWLLAVICLAWPVTSFILARRRRKGRGFEVEARPGAAPPPPES